MKQQANEALKPGTAGLFLLIRKMTTDKVLEDLKGVGGTVIRTSFDHAKEDALKTALAAHVPVPAPATPEVSRPRSRRPPPRPDRRWKNSVSNLRGNRARAFPGACRPGEGRSESARPLPREQPPLWVSRRRRRGRMHRRSQDANRRKPRPEAYQHIVYQDPLRASRVSLHRVLLLRFILVVGDLGLLLASSRRPSVTVLVTSLPSRTTTTSILTCRRGSRRTRLRPLHLVVRDKSAFIFLANASVPATRPGRQAGVHPPQSAVDAGLTRSDL